MFNLTEANRKWWTLIAMSSALALVFIDQTALAVALPAIQRNLNLSNNLTQWVINAYLLSLGSLILLGGKIGDGLGHKRAFLFGVIVFISASILCALAQSGTWILAARALQGLGGAFMIPATTALITNAFPDTERGKALGIYVALAAIFLAFGPLLGGALTQWFGWRSIFWINFPIAIISVILGHSVVPRWERNKKLNLDYLGVILSIGFISGIVLGFMQAPHWGWTSPTTLLLFSFSIFGFIAFIFWERRCKHPLVELSLFKNPTFSLLTAIIIMLQALSIVFVFWAIFLQSVLQYSPLMAGLLLLPSMVPVIFMAPVGGHLRDKYGPMPPMFGGCVLILSCLIWIGLFCYYQNYAWLFPAFVAYGLGVPLMLGGSSATIMSTVTAQQRGIAGAIFNCARQLGGSIGLAVLGGFLASLNTWKLTAFLQQAPTLVSVPENLVDGLLIKSDVAMKAVSHLSAPSVTLLKTGALKSYVYAFSMTMFLGAGFALVCLFLVAKLPRKLD